MKRLQIDTDLLFVRRAIAVLAVALKMTDTKLENEKYIVFAIDYITTKCEFFLQQPQNSSHSGKVSCVLL